MSGLDRRRLSRVGSPVTLEVPRPARRCLRGAVSADSAENAPRKPECPRRTPVTAAEKDSAVTAATGAPDCGSGHRARQGGGERCGGGARAGVCGGGARAGAGRGRGEGGGGARAGCAGAGAGRGRGCAGAGRGRAAAQPGSAVIRLLGSRSGWDRRLRRNLKTQVRAMWRKTGACLGIGSAVRDPALH